MKKIVLSIFSVSIAIAAIAGNPDRQGEAGAFELLMIPWARTAGLHAMNTAFIGGVEAMRLNVAGLTRINQTEVLIGHTRYLEGTNISINAVGLSQRVGQNGAFGISIMALDLGDIAVTTADQPEGTGATYSPNFFNIGLGYAYTFGNKVSVGILIRGISESTADLSAFGFALDAGVQYVSGEKDNFKFGISLRNVGSPMRFSGEGLSFQGDNPGGNTNYNLTYDQRSASFEIPSVLNIGTSYDFYATDDHRITVLANFTANSFSTDQLGGGIEYAFKDLIMLRAGYKKELSNLTPEQKNVYTGLSAGASIQLRLSAENDNKLGIDYAFRASSPWSGSHNLSVRISI